MENIDEEKDVANELATKIKIPKDVREMIYTKLFKNFCMAILIFLFFMFLNLGYAKLEPTVFEEDLHMFAGILIISTIMVFELAYRKDNGEIAIHGIEMLVLSVLTLFMPYIYFHREVVVRFLYSFSSMYIAIYYSIKCLVVYGLEVKKYKQGLSDVKELIDEEKSESYLDEINERKFNDVEETDAKKKIEEKSKVNTISKKKVVEAKIEKQDDKPEEKKETKPKAKSATKKVTTKAEAEKAEEKQETKPKAKTVTKKTTTKAKAEKVEEKQEAKPKAKTTTKKATTKMKTEKIEKKKEEKSEEKLEPKKEVENLKQK